MPRFRHYASGDITRNRTSGHRATICPDDRQRPYTQGLQFIRSRLSVWTSELGSPLFRAALGKTGKLSRRTLARIDAADMLKRRLKQAGLSAHNSPHSFRASCITNSWKMTALWKPLTVLLVTLTAGPPNFMIAAARRFCSKIWSGSAIDDWQWGFEHQANESSIAQAHHAMHLFFLAALELCRPVPCK